MPSEADAYWSILKVNFKDSLSDRTDFIVTGVFSLATAIIMIVVWTAVYSATGQQTIMGVGLVTLYVYFLFVSGLRSIFDMNIPTVMSDDITSGNIAVSMTRPISYVSQVITACFGSMISQSLIAGVPLLVIGLIFLNVHLTLATVGLFLVELAIGYVIASCIEFMIGCSAIFMTQIWGLVVMNWMLIYLLGGGIIPLNFMPQWALTIVNLLPFKYLLYVPAATLLGISTVNVVNTLALGGVWCAILVACAWFSWTKVKKSVSAVGG